MRIFKDYLYKKWEEHQSKILSILQKKKNIYIYGKRKKLQLSKQK